MTDDAPEPSEAHDDDSGWAPPLWLIGVAVVALVGAVVVGIPIFQALYTLVFPPEPPLPDGVIELEAENLGHGYDRWLYQSTLNVCEVAAFYEESGSRCFTPPGMCVDGEYNRVGYPVEFTPTCVGADTYSAFGVRWELTMDSVWTPTNPDAQDGTVFSLERETLWSGPSPVSTSTPPPS